VLWQRSLEDALVLAKSEGRPLFIAVNMDGESASERIVKENYRNPEFVALSRRFVCVIASAFRHEQRDHDDLGRRIPCPRLGEVTCGEHIALEPILFEKYLGGERIAPRHALILPDGTKSFDLFLLFDLGDLDRRLAQSIGTAPPPRVVSAPPGSGSSWIELASARDHRGRLAFETRILTAITRQERSSVLKAIADAGDGGSVDALRVLVSSPPSPSGDTVLEIGSVASTLKIESQVAAMVRERVLGLGRWPGAAGLDEDGELLLLLGDLDGASSATRSLLLAQAMLGSVPDSSIAREALRRAGVTDGPMITAISRPRPTISIGSSTASRRWMATSTSRS
jgi:hypothetical protein